MTAAVAHQMFHRTYLALMRIKLASTVAFVSLPFLSNGQQDTASFNYPHLPAHCKSIDELVPPDWHKIQEASGDLDRDGRVDVILAIEFKDSVRHVRPDGWFSNTQPRILAIALGAEDQGFKLFTQSNTFLLREDEGGMSSPELMLSVDKDTLLLGFQLTRGAIRYWFCYNHGELACVRFTNAGVSGGIIESTELDLLKNSALLQKGPVGKDTYDSEEIKTIPEHPPFTLERLRWPMRTEVLPNVHL